MKTAALSLVLVSATAFTSAASAAGPVSLEHGAFRMKRYSYQLSRSLRASFAFTPHYQSLRAYNYELYRAADRLQRVAFHPHNRRVAEIEIEEIGRRLAQITALVEDLKDVIAGPVSHGPAHIGHYHVGPTLRDLERLCEIVDCMDETLLELRTACGRPVEPVPPIVPAPQIVPPTPNGVGFNHNRLRFQKGRFGFSLVLN